MVGARRKPALIGSLIRGHWKIESGLQWPDVTWREDSIQIREDNSPHVMEFLRNIAIAIMYLEGEPHHAKATRAAHNYPHLALKLAGPNINQPTLQVPWESWGPAKPV
ncbi:hypothetical protein JOF48_000310 [Arthrobacter stackebrandtii]|uniref:Uncharacterized protein n=1 Tax=Arthrobacter stackebrandtii TaxID=272161 RepID=A0ABS4YRT4_9MICC|nr:hypothetical protein [Arthrobacter stackebrandtii]MBP2411511.1 hypothetical protein [Arthrobacter stackebrandtii]PYH00217.1 hypothetical protein CVV67_10655 [Arthrobacter stackebrandtii]